MESTGNAADTDFISKNSLAKKTRAIEVMSQEENLVFSLGAGKKPPPLTFQLVEIATSFLFSHFLPQSAPWNGALTRPDSTPQEKMQRNGPEKESNS